MVTEVFERLLESLANIYCAVYVLGRAKHCGHRWISIDFALQGFGSSSGPVGDAEERTIPSTVSPYIRTFKLQTCKDANMLSVKVRCEWNCSLCSISYCWWSLSSIITHPLCLLQAVTLLACSLGANLCMPAVASSVQLLSRVQLFVTPWTAAHQASLSITNSWSLLKLLSIESVLPSNHLILCRPLLLFNLFQHQGLFQWVSSSHQVAKVLESQLQHQSF